MYYMNPSVLDGPVIYSKPQHLYIYENDFLQKFVFGFGGKKLIKFGLSGFISMRRTCFSKKID